MNLASQWGRDTTFQPGRRSAGPIILVAILSLALGFGGGYAAFRYLQPALVTQQDISAPPVEADPDIARLTEALALAAKDLEAARAAEAARSAEVEELRAQTARQAADLDAMAERLAEMSDQSRPPIMETAAAVESLTRERDKLAAANQSLAADLAALEADREALRQEAAAAQARLEGEIARLSGQVVPDLSAERDRLQRQTSLLLADKTALEARVKAADEARAAESAAREELTRLQTEILPQLTAERDRLQQQIGDMETDQAALQRQTEAATKTRASYAATISRLAAELEDVRRELTATQAELTALKLHSGAAPVPGSGTGAAADSPPNQPAATPTAQDMAPLSPRPEEAVFAALRAAPGLGALSGAQRQALADRLIAGECVTTALEAVFDRVPILTLRNLIRDLNSEC